MKVEELAYKWKEIRRVAVTPTVAHMQFRGDTAILKNGGLYPIHLMTKNIDNDKTFHQNWNVIAEESSYLLQPGETVGPLWADNLYVKTALGTGSLVIIVQEVR